MQDIVRGSVIYAVCAEVIYREPDVYLGLFADDTCIYATHCKEGYILRKLQRGLSAIETWCERCNIKINEDKTQIIYFLIHLGPLKLILQWTDGTSPSSTM
jgi:hypothetical protein